MTPRELIVAIRSLGWTQKQIAERVGVHQSTISLIEKEGGIEDPSYSLGKRLELLHAEVVLGKAEA